jgi:DNA-binding CsgD family transcriptional regulator
LRVFEDDPMYIGSIALADAVEAMVRSGDHEGARRALSRLAVRASASGTPWALGLEARAAALVAGDNDAETLYQESLDHLGRSGVAAEVGRTRLLYGEWLRRRRRRRDARDQLREAYDMLQSMGIEGFANRARLELLATGEQARARTGDSRDELTPQEKQVARLAADGDSNAEIAAQMFISPHTVAYHLRKVFGKLGINSRGQLAAALDDPVQAARASGGAYA